MLHAEGISVFSGNRFILDHVNVTLMPGKFTVVVGRNGAGKSTLLKVISGELNPAKGSVSINGKASSRYTPEALSWLRAVLPQNTEVHFPFNVEQVIHLGRHARRCTRQENAAVVDEVMELTGTLPLRERMYETLSGGERQRVQLARVLAQVWEESLYPRYILLDEPTSSLDIAQQQLIFSLTQSVASRNIGVMAIVHDLNQAVQFADQLYFMSDGKITAAGPSHEVFTKTNIEKTFCCRVHVYHDPCNNCPYIIPDRGGNLKLGITKG